MKTALALLSFSLILPFTARAEEQTYVAKCNMGKDGRVGSTEYILRKGEKELSDSYVSVTRVGRSKIADFKIVFTPREDERYESVLSIELSPVEIDETLTTSLSAYNFVLGKPTTTMGVMMGQTVDHWNFPSAIICRVQP